MRLWRAARVQISGAALALLCYAISSKANASDVPTVDAGIGSCRAAFTVKDSDGKPLYNAKIDVTIKYGFLNKRRTDLEAATNGDGQALFTGLPNFSKRPLEFIIKSGTVSRAITDDPLENCNATFTVTLTVH